MKSVLLLSVLLCVAAFVRSAAVLPMEDVVMKEEISAPLVLVNAAAEDLKKVIPVKSVEELKEETHHNVSAPVQGRFVSCPRDWEGYQGSCYLLVSSSVTWSNAEAYCAGQQAHLVSAHSLWEYDFLQRLARSKFHSSVWMGGFYFQGRWRWEDNMVYNYENWYSLSSSSSYPCIYLNGYESRGWSNSNCNSCFPFICVKRFSQC